MAAQQRRLLTAANSKLGKTNITRVLDKDDAWAMLPIETRQQLYALMPKPKEGDPQHDVDVHPLRTPYRTYINNELRRWQHDLTEGREVKKWREEAMKVGRERAEGQFDEWKAALNDEYWGTPAANDENKPPEATTLKDDDDKVVVTQAEAISHKADTQEEERSHEMRLAQEQPGAADDVISGTAKAVGHEADAENIPQPQEAEFEKEKLDTAQVDISGDVGDGSGEAQLTLSTKMS